MGRIAGLVLAAGLAGGLAAGAQTIDASDPEALARFMQNYGYRAELTVDGQGDPLILSSAVGARFIVYFYGCDDGDGCRQILLQSGFGVREGIGLDAINTWNRDQLVGTAFIDAEGDPYLEHFVVLEGGVARSTFRSVLDLWEEALGAFRSHLQR